MKSSHPAHTIFYTIALWLAFLCFTKPALAVEYQNCNTNQNCTIGEFLYDDSYTPNATASCSITSRAPDGSIFINSATASANSSAWYSYTFAVGSTEGLYPTNICCTTSTDYLCLDKSFIAKAPPTTASDVWNYSDRTVTSFGSLVSDVWNYSSRSISNIGDLVSSVWTHNDRSLSSPVNLSLATISDIKDIKKSLAENRLLLEQLVNKPIVQTFIDESNPIPNLSEKMERTKTSATNLYSNIQNIKSRVTLLSQNWSNLKEPEIKSELSALSTIYKQDLAQKDSNIMDTSKWLKDSWSNPILLSIADKSQGIQNQIDNLINDINLYGKVSKVSDLDNISKSIDKLSDLVGTTLAQESDLSLYGFIKKTQNQISLLDKLSSDGNKLLSSIKANPDEDKTDNILQLQDNILSLNKVPDASIVLYKPTKETNTQSNKVLGLLALIDTNKLIISANNDQTVKNIWLEEGSIIFRAVATNPSYSLTQKVLVKYYLPTEIKKEQIINNDPQLSIDYDTAQNAYYASGEISLAPQETRTFLVEVEDIWNFRQEEIDSLKNQVNELVDALKGTQNFTQAVTIKSDIVVALDKIMLKQKEAVTPENRIRTYRESSIEMNGIEEKINTLRELTIQAKTTPSLLGFSGSQSVVYLGIITFIIATIGFFIFYFNTLKTDHLPLIELTKPEDPMTRHNEIYHPTPQKHHHKETHHHHGHKIARIASISLLAAGMSSLAASSAIKISSYNTLLVSPSQNKTSVLGVSVEKKYPYKSSVTALEDSNVPVRSSSSITSPEVFSLHNKQAIYIYKIKDQWAQIGLTDKDQDKNLWVNKKYISD